MICCKAIGRLANQIANHAFAHAVAEHLQTTYLTNAYYLKYFELESPIKSRFHNFFNAYLRAMSWIPSAKVYRWWRDGSFRLLSFFCGCWSKLDMYVQPNIFKNGQYVENGYYDTLPLEILQASQANVKKLFSIKPQYQQAFQQQYAPIFAQQKTAVLHIRRTDFMTWGGLNHALPLEYYYKALSLIPNLADYQLFVLSDDIIWAKENVQLQAGSQFVSNDEITDFQFFIHADAVIIANSSYSAYGAWFNSKPNKQIFQPTVIRQSQTVPYSGLGAIDNWQVVDIGFKPL